MLRLAVAGSDLQDLAATRLAVNRASSRPQDDPLPSVRVCAARCTKPACVTATRVLAHKVPDVEALGVFALCSAVTGDRRATESALTRLKEAETSPYFGPLAQGVLHLRDKQPEKAQASWR